MTNESKKPRLKFLKDRLLGKEKPVKGGHTKIAEMEDYNWFVKKFIKGERGSRGPKGDNIKGDEGESIVGPQGYSPIKGKDYFTKEEIVGFKKSITPIKDKDYKDGKSIKGDKGDSIKGDTGKPGKNADEDKIFQALIERMEGKIDETLTEKEKELLDKLYQKLITMVQSLQVHGGGLGRAEILKLIAGASGNAGRTDLSAQCNSVNLVFTMDDNFTAGTDIVRYSSFPFIYRPGVDYTVTGTKEITFVGAEVEAPKTGQTLMASYEKA